MSLRERAIASPQATVGVIIDPTVEGMPHGIWRIEKYDADELDWYLKRGLGMPAPYEDPLEFLNAYTNAGGALLLDLLMGAGGTAYNNANSYIGTGDSNTANSVSQTDLQAASNKLRVAMDSTFPSRASQTATWKATFTSGNGNYHWQEIALFNNATVGTMLSRIVQDMGTKASGTSWVPSYTITVP